MAGSAVFIVGHARIPLISRVGSAITQGGSAGSPNPSSADFGAIDVSKFSGISGYVRCDSVGATGASLRVRYGINSGTYHITSTMPITSGGVIYDQVNYGRVADFAITGTDSGTTYSILLQGEPIR
jgi:hypothetical protein